MSKQIYVKVAFQNKIKKYAISDITEIKFKQIKESFGLNQKWKDCLFFYQIVQDFNSPEGQDKISFTEEDLIKHFQSFTLLSNSTIKLRIVQRTLMSEEEKRRKESYQSMEIPQKIQKKRSKSMQLQMDVFDQTCKTQVFQMTNNFIVTNDSITFQSNQPQEQKNQYLDGLQIRKTLTKSTQVSINKEKYFQRNTDKLLASWTASSDFERIRNCLHDSLKMAQKQKSQLQKLKEKINKKQKELQQTRKISNVDEIMKILDLQH